MSDIVERLRDDPQRNFSEAIDEIERLRQENDALRNGLDGADRLSNAFAETACRRGARMQIMREYIGKYAAGNLWRSFISAHPEAAEWFDGDGICR